MNLLSLNKNYSSQNYLHTGYLILTSSNKGKLTAFLLTTPCKEAVALADKKILKFSLILKDLININIIKQGSQGPQKLSSL